MKYENKYIQYLIDNKKSIDTELLDHYFLDKIDFNYFPQYVLFIYIKYKICK